MGKLKQEVPTLVGYLLFGGVTLYGDALLPTALPEALAAVVFALLFSVMLWLAFSVVRHAECLAELLGEPYGTLILTLSVIGIEVALISSVMITGADRPTLARDTMFSVVMIVLNGLVGLSLVTGGLRHRFQDYNLKGANAYLAVLIPLAVLTLVLPRYSHSAPGGEMSLLQAGFFIVMSLLLYGVFLAIQTITHSEMFKAPSQTIQQGSGQETDHGDGHHDLVVHSIPFHAVGLLAAMLPIVLLSKKLAIYVEFGIDSLGAPVALGGFLIAALVLTPEGLGAIKAARSNQLQRAVNICLGSALATIGLTVPAVLIIGMVMDSPVELGLGSVDIIILVLSLVVSLVTFVSARTNFLLGAVHLSLFAAYVMLIFDGQ